MNYTKEEIYKIIRNILLILIVVYFGYIIISGEIGHNKAVKEFCKQQCDYNPDTKNWSIDLQWFFDKEGLQSRMETKKSFPEKDLDECVKYCKDLEKEFKYLNQ